MHSDYLELLQATSRTFYIPISRLPAKLQEAVASAYLCMRAIDEIEDSPQLDSSIKMQLLQQISLNLQTGSSHSKIHNFTQGLESHEEFLPEVSLRIGEWALLAAPEIAPRIWDATAAMAERMAYWAGRNWTIATEADLDLYTFSVAGAVGLLLSDLWAWYDGTQTNRTQAIGFGRGLQAVNIVRNHSDDLARGVNFFPHNWTSNDMQSYAHRQLKFADAYINSLPVGPALDFCQIPLTLARGTLDVLALGKEKLTRHDVLQLVENLKTICS